MFLELHSSARTDLTNKLFDLKGIIMTAQIIHFLLQVKQITTGDTILSHQIGSGPYRALACSRSRAYERKGVPPSFVVSKESNFTRLRVYQSTKQIANGLESELDLAKLSLFLRSLSTQSVWLPNSVSCLIDSRFRKRASELSWHSIRAVRIGESLLRQPKPEFKREPQDWISVPILAAVILSKHADVE